MKQKIVAALALLAVLAPAACSTEPMRVRTPLALDDPETQKPPGDLLSLCVNELATGEEELRMAALEFCPAGTLERVEDDVFWTPCPLLLPKRVTYRCLAP